MAPGGRDKKLCDCFASTLRKEREGRRWEVMSECYIWKPDPSASGRFYDLSRQHHHLETKSSNTRPLGDNSHSSHNSFGKTINWWGGVGKKEPPLEPALRASALRDRRGVTGTLDKQRSKQNPRPSRDLGKCVYGHSTVTVVLVLNWCKLSN